MKVKHALLIASATTAQVATVKVLPSPGQTESSTPIHVGVQLCLDSSDGDCGRRTWVRPILKMKGRSRDKGGEDEQRSKKQRVDDESKLRE